MSTQSSTSRDARRVVLGAAVGFDVEQVRVFVESLRAVGYGGDVVMLVGPFQFALSSYLRRYGVRPVSAFYIRRLNGPIFTYRFELLTHYLQRRSNRYDQVLIADVRDVVFQSHPFDGITSPSCHFFLESADCSIGNEPSNIRWLRTFLTPKQVETISPYPISCCGVSIGGIAAMLAYLNRMAAYLHAVPLKIKRRHGADTAFHNLIVHLTREVDCVVIENNRQVATMGIEPPSRYVVGPDNIIRTADGHLPAILHQYDRFPQFLEAVEARCAAK